MGNKWTINIILKKNIVVTLRIREIWGTLKIIWKNKMHFSNCFLKKTYFKFTINKKGI